MSQKLKNVQQNLPQRSNQKKLKKIGTVSNGSTVSYTDKHRLNRPAYALSMQTRYGKYKMLLLSGQIQMLFLLFVVGNMYQETGQIRKRYWIL